MALVCPETLTRSLPETTQEIAKLPRTLTADKWAEARKDMSFWKIFCGSTENKDDDKNCKDEKEHTQDNWVEQEARVRHNHNSICEEQTTNVHQNHSEGIEEDFIKSHL